MEVKDQDDREEKKHDEDIGYYGTGEFNGSVADLRELCNSRGFKTKSNDRKYLKGRLSYLHGIHIDARGLLNYRGRENINDIKSFLWGLLAERHIPPSNFLGNKGIDYESIIGFLSGGSGGNHWVFTFEPDNNVDDGEIMMRMIYVDRNGLRVPLLEKPSRVIVSEQKEIVQHLRDYIANNHIHAENQFGYFHMTTGTRLILQNTQTGETMDGGFPQEQCTLEISNDNAVRAWVDNLSEVLEGREAGFIKDGYEWRIEDFGGFDFKFSPRSEHRSRKWSKVQTEEHETQKKKKERIENEAKAVKEKSKKWVLGHNKLKIGRRINLPKWWFKKVGPDIVTDKNDCVYRSILRSVIKKEHHINSIMKKHIRNSYGKLKVINSQLKGL